MLIEAPVTLSTSIQHGRTQGGGGGGGGGGVDGFERPPSPKRGHLHHWILFLFKSPFMYAKYDCVYAYYAVPVMTAKCKLITLSHVTVLVVCMCSPAPDGA